MANRKMVKKSSNKSRVETSGMSYDTKIVIVVILLVFAYPVGVALMWAWMRDWPLWLKIFVTLPLILGTLFIIVFIALVGKFVKDTVHEQKYSTEQQSSPSATQNRYLSPTFTPGKAY